MHKEKFQECHIQDFFDQEHKRNFFWMLIFENTSNANLLYVFLYR